MKIQRAAVAVALAVTFASFPATAFGLQVHFGFVLPDTGEFINISGFPTAEVADCTIPSGGTQCTVQVSIPSMNDPNGFKIFSGGVVKATKTSGSVNKVAVSNLTVQWLGSGGVRFGLRFFHGFTGVSPFNRGYGQAASGNFCRPDSNGNCQNAANDIVQLNSSVTFVKNNGETTTFGLPQSGPYTVSAGGVANNNYFPQSVLPSTSATFSCPYGGACQSLEFIGSQLVFQFNQRLDAVVQKATHSQFTGPNLGLVQNALNAEAVDVDLQPIPDKNNNDLNLSTNGNRQVAVFSQVDATTTPPTVIFDPNSIYPGTLGMSVGDGGVVPPASVNLSAGDLNGDGVNDIIGTWNITDLRNAGGACLPGIGGVYVISGTADFVSTFTTETKVRGQTVIETHTQTDTLPFSGQQPFTCAPSAGL